MNSKNDFPNVREFHEYVVNRGLCENPELTLRTPMGDILDFPLELHDVKMTVRASMATLYTIVKVNFPEFQSRLIIKAINTLDSSIHVEWNLKREDAETPYYESYTSVKSTNDFYCLVMELLDIFTGCRELYLDNKTQQ